MFNPEEGITLISGRREPDAPGTRFWDPKPNDDRSGRPGSCTYPRRGCWSCELQWPGSYSIVV